MHAVVFNTNGQHTMKTKKYALKEKAQGSPVVGMWILWQTCQQ